MRRQDESEFYVLLFFIFCEDVCVWILLDEIQSVFKQIIHVLLSWLENEGRKEQFSQDNEHQLCLDQNPEKYLAHDVVILGQRVDSSNAQNLQWKDGSALSLSLSLSQLLRNN
jgi:hypothetical protein